MPTIEELKKEIERIKRDNSRKEQQLRNFEQSKKEIVSIGREKKKLSKELKMLRNPKSTAFKKNLKRGLKITGKGLGRGLKKTGKGLFVALERIQEAEEEESRREKRPTKKSKSTKKARLPKGKVTIKKQNGGYSVNIAGKKFEAATDKAAAKSKASRIKRLQGKTKARKKR